ncbi:unnamed protein product [Ambrosiozyma monospora]|uniref:Unnamed protein product n=1 Tax=Ambrosiozyma monospora TaxID=43982 RepID=A0ACB5SYD8_AMBMO|nr:unnamed protein product [Ambrosiozyma monospora]
MKFSTTLLFASSAFGYVYSSAYSTINRVSTDIETIYSCGNEVTNCPYSNSTHSITTYEGAAAVGYGSYYAAGAAALAAGAFLL